MAHDPAAPIRRAARLCVDDGMDLRAARAAFDRAYAKAALWRAQGVRGVAAAALQVDRTTLTRILAGRPPPPAATQET